jgi:hypothetical protein
VEIKAFHLVWRTEHSTSCGKQSHLVWTKPIIPLHVEIKAFHLVWKTEHSTSCGKQAVHLVWTKFLFPPCVGTLFCFTKSKNLNPILTQSTKTKINTSQRHQCSNIKSNLMHDIETNPGPGKKLKIITINCRGLGKIKKFRLSLNKA